MKYPITVPSAINPLTLVNSCDRYAETLIPGDAGYLMVDAGSIQQVEGVVWERLIELPVPLYKSAFTFVPELNVFRSSRTTDGGDFNPDIETAISFQQVRYWDTTRVKNEVVISMNGGLPKDINATVVAITTIDETQEVFNTTFENDAKLTTYKKVDASVSRVRAHWRFWRYKYQNGERVVVNGKYVTEPLGEIEHIEDFDSGGENELSATFRYLTWCFIFLYTFTGLPGYYLFEHTYLLMPAFSSVNAVSVST
ncbi:MAG: hypothetical protein KIT80_09845 [Chitinophagaceae bacterium]|nr:hypothetical protein [Chitinophagaceae bacterium]MCW5927202.1 hypothetical protein [Chitinophagaceae bacterium]